MDRAPVPIRTSAASSPSPSSPSGEGGAKRLVWRPHRARRERRRSGDRPGTEGATARELYEGVGEPRKREVEEGSACSSLAAAYPIVGVCRSGEVAVTAPPQDRWERWEGARDVEEDGAREREREVELVAHLLLSMSSSGSIGSGRVPLPLNQDRREREGGDGDAEEEGVEAGDLVSHRPCHHWGATPDMRKRWEMGKGKEEGRFHRHVGPIWVLR
uniref:Uncharacterized protein n=1 Tax=Oryza meridionalis TaxID=40149 RepID=A0A0E0EXT9_9ORYZ